ncbi:hypothetical protein SKAU_G00381180 [Synaphobranchus kaupii]|uniref:Uncharacterized protein n=1 Tax=Synaphobranchus kaupii TaxID=118154 RepID=A0A9Q1ICN1_SYNKA|nr:hypothetical protein SKAU_G00381180 [Synaphobranchus kaupii]
MKDWDLSDLCSTYSQIIATNGVSDWFAVMSDRISWDLAFSLGGEPSHTKNQSLPARLCQEVRSGAE